MQNLEVEKEQPQPTNRQHHHHHQQQQQQRGRHPRRSGGGRYDQHKPSTLEMFKSDFDFESSNAKFNKDEIVKEVAKKTTGEDDEDDSQDNHQPDEEEVYIPPPEDEPYYDKVSVLSKPHIYVSVKAKRSTVIEQEFL